MRNIKSVLKIKELTGDKYDNEFISNLLFNFKNLTGTQVNTIKNVLYYNSEVHEDDFVDHIKKCFDYCGSKSSSEYKRFIYGITGYNNWLVDTNKTRDEMKNENLKEPTYIKNMYCKSLSKETGFDIEFLYEIVKYYVPLSEQNRDIIIRVLKLKRFKTIDEINKNIKSLIEYTGSRSNNNSEYGIMLLGEEGYNNYMNESISMMKQTKKENFSNSYNSVERFIKISNTIIKNNNIDYDEKFIAEIMMSTIDFNVENDLHKRWLSDQLIYQQFKTIEDHSENLTKIINFTGNRKHSIEWETLRFGSEEAENRHLISSSIFSSINNPTTIKRRYNNSTDKDKIYYIKCLFDKNSEFYINDDISKYNQTFYIINISEDIFKVGVTRDFSRRFLRHKFNKSIVLYETNLYEALMLEIIFKILYGDVIDEFREDGFGYTETFNGLSEEIMIDRFNKIKQIIKKHS